MSAPTEIELAPGRAHKFGTFLGVYTPTILTILGVILKAPPVKQALASQQLQSLYVNRVLARQN